jgi:hypothetical protein
MVKDDKIEISLLYIKNFKYKNEMDSELMGGHPICGRVYQAFSEVGTQRYNIHFDEYKVNGKTGGIVLKGLKSNNNFYSCEAVLVNKDNFLDLKITEEDLKKINTWQETDNKELWEILSGDSLVEVEIPKVETAELTTDMLNDLISQLTISEKSPEIAVEEDSEEGEDVLEFLYRNDPDMLEAVSEILGHIISTYGDKYNSDSLPNLGKLYALSSVGKSLNIGTALKYLQRYSTEGYEKSSNIVDIFKAIHYLLFEVIRKNKNDKQ